MIARDLIAYFGVFALVSCGPGSSPRRAVVAAPSAHPPTAAPPKTLATGHLAWITKLDVDAGFPALAIEPDAFGGALVHIVTVRGDSKGFSATGTVTMHVDGDGDAGRVPSPFDVESDDPGLQIVGADGAVAIVGRAIPEKTIANVKVSDSYVVQFDTEKKLVWQHSLGRALPSTGTRTKDGGIAIAGLALDPTDFGGGVIGGSREIFLAVFDAHGKHVFSRAFATNDLYGNALKVRVNDAGEITLVGPMASDATPDFGGGPLSDASSGTFAATFDAHGKNLRAFGMRLAVQGTAMGGGGDIVLSGTVPGDKPYERIREVVHVDAKGHELWRRSFGEGEMANDFLPVEIDAHGNTMTAVTHLRDNGPSTEVMLIDGTGKTVFTQRIEGLALISAIAFTPNGEALLGGAAAMPGIRWSDHDLETNDHGGLFVAKLDE